jgi:hypothetical protein
MKLKIEVVKNHEIDDYQLYNMTLLYGEGSQFNVNYETAVYSSPAVGVNGEGQSRLIGIPAGVAVGDSVWVELEIPEEVGSSGNLIARVTVDQYKPGVDNLKFYIDGVLTRGFSEWAHSHFPGNER